MPTKLDDYANKYQCVRFERRDGILQMTLHTDGGSLRWGFGPHGELPDALHNRASSPAGGTLTVAGMLSDQLSLGVLRPAAGWEGTDWGVNKPF